MGLRFQRSLGLAKGLKLNFSKSGLSLSVGRKGFTTNLGPRGVRSTAGLPGTGLSYRSSPLKSWAWIALVIIVALLWAYA